VVDKTIKAYQEFSPKTVVIAGGVAANLELRKQLEERLPIDIEYAPINLCTDNAAMIASLGYFHAQQMEADSPHELEINTSLTM
jgi:N6-L-threonylcarbamoyladenine synthase